MSAPPVAPELLTEPDLHATGDRWALWRWMRDHQPLYWHEPAEFPGFWSVTRHEDISAVYRDPRAFSSARGVLLRPGSRGADPGGGLTLALTDPPRHQQLRRLVAEWFGKRSARQWEAAIGRAVRAVLDHAARQPRVDAVHDVAARSTHHLVCGLLGIPEQDHDDLFEWTDQAFTAGTSLAAHYATMRYFAELMARRAADPGPDLISALMHGFIDDTPLTEEEVVLNIENIVGASENARLSIAGGLRALLEHPDQWRLVRENRELLPAAVEEVLRWTSSAAHSMRTATESRVLHGRRIDPGDRVVLWVPSANRDERVFARPDRFDVTRRPNRHIALGTGEHVCIGSTMARTQMRILFGELLYGGWEVQAAGEAVPVRSIAVAGPERLPVRIRRVEPDAVSVDAGARS
ncbi:cytochrome P450 [Nocardia takedensis]